MKITDQEIYHGSGLVRIVEHDSFKALNRGKPLKYGHYLINDDRHVFAKHSSNKWSPWQFTFQPDDLKSIRAAGEKTFVMLVCGRVTVCALTLEELNEVIDLKSAAAQSVTINVPAGGSCHVKGTKGAMSKTIPHSSFPGKLFA